MNSMIDTAIDQCYECQVATKGNREEPIKVTNIPSTDFQAKNKERLKYIFATYGTPRRIESDNGPPFNSKEFNKFAEEEGFQQGDTSSLKSEWRSRKIHGNPKQDRTNCKSARQKAP